jgi:phage shock protein E
MITYLPWLALIAGVGAFLFVLPRLGGRTTGEEAREILEKGGRLVDVRTPREFASGHLPGAVNLPVDDLVNRLREVGPKDTPVVVYCASGNRSAQAASLLRAQGYTSIADLGAMRRW